VIEKEILSYYVVYRSGEKRKELLRDHIKKTLSYLDEFDNSRVDEYARRQLRIGNFREMIEYAIIFHDIGKVFFQSEKHIRRSPEAEYLSFRGHEFLSALLVDLFLSRMKGEQYEMNYIPVTFSIFYHHHAMNPAVRKVNIGPLRPLEGQYMDRIYSVLSDFLDKERREVLSSCLTEFMNRVSTLGFVEYLRKKLYNVVLFSVRGPVLGKVSLLLLDCLVACDYMAAQDREGGRSVFFHAVSEFYKVWMRLFKASAVEKNKS